MRSGVRLAAIDRFSLGGPPLDVGETGSQKTARRGCGIGVGRGCDPYPVVSLHFQNAVDWTYSSSLFVTAWWSGTWQ